jgi:hypothetical protein
MLAKLKSSLREFYPYAKKRLGFDRPVRLFLRNDPHNAEQVYGKTAYYDPQEEKVVLYVTNRHPKDILRSFAHELVHHKQNCEGRLSGLTAGEGYAQTELGDKLETEAYVGSKLVRDYEDTRRKQMTTEELKQKVESIVKEYLDEKKGKYDDGDGKDEKCDYVDCEGEGEKKEKVDEVEEVDEGSCGKRDPKDDKEEKLDEYGADPNAGTPFAATPGGRVPDDPDLYKKKKKPEDDKKEEMKEDMDEKENEKELKAAQERGAKVKKALGESKKVIKEAPQPKSEQTNDDWYWNSLYSKLKDKWTK